jgi:two-component system chemotaxis sensor kinase CheA
MTEFLEQFLIECRELVEQASADLLALEQNPGDGERLASAFRAFHTLKGAAGIIEFPAMARLLHAAEDVLASLRAGDQPVTVDLISLCLVCVDQVVTWLDVMEDAGEPPTDADAAADRLAARFAPAASGPVVAATLEKRPPAWIAALQARYPRIEAATALRYTPDAACFFRGEDPLWLVAGSPGLLAVHVSPAGPWPSAQDLDPFACNLVIEALLSAPPDGVREHLRSVSDQVRIHGLPKAMGEGVLAGLPLAVIQAQIAMVSAPPGEALDGRLRSAERVVRQVLGQAGLDAGPITSAIDESLASGDPAAFVDAIATALRPALSAEHADDTDTGVPGSGIQDIAARALRVDVERIDAIIKLTGELTVVKNALGHAAGVARDGDPDNTLAETLKTQHALLERLTIELQRSVVAIRVLPLRHVFQRFSRLVREMTASLGKSARLVIEGDNTEADKAVVEALFEPLLHVIRNALDHGVEDRAARRAADKPETAVIRLRGYREGERVIVEVSDDGGGVDVAVIRRVAAARGLISDDELAAMSDDDVVDLIFAPGFSTAAAVTGLSGRGVGMDAVRASIERLGGRVSVHARVGQGTSVRFVLPFTVMITQVMIVEAAGQAFGVPFEAVVETLRLRPEDISPIGSAEVFVLRGRTVPLVRLDLALGLPSPVSRSDAVMVVVTTVAGQLNAFQVDGFGARLDVMLKPMDGLLAGMRGIAGTTLLGDGRVLIVLDLPELLR